MTNRTSKQQSNGTNQRVMDQLLEEKQISHQWEKSGEDVIPPVRDNKWALQTSKSIFSHNKLSDMPPNLYND